MVKGLRLSLIQKPGAGRGIWQGTTLIPPKDSVPVVRHNFVEPITDWTGNNTKQRSGHSPNSAQLSQDEGNGLRPGQQKLPRLFVVSYNANRIETVCVGAVTAENLSGQCVLQRSKPKCGFLVASHNELHETIAQAANSIVKHDWRGHGDDTHDSSTESPKHPSSKPVAQQVYDS